LLASGLVNRRLDVDALGEFVAWEYVPAPRTSFQDVRKLEAGHLLEVDLASGSGRERAYWDVPLGAPEAASSDDEWAARADAAIGSAVRQRRAARCLSFRRRRQLARGCAHGCCANLQHRLRDPSYNELDWEKRVARHLGVAHDFEIIAPRVVDLFDQLMDYMDDPLGDCSIFPTYLVSRHARRQVTVALSGDGGDELFGGYETFLAQARSKQWQQLPHALRARLFEPLLDRLPPTEHKGLINKANRFVEGLEHDPALHALAPVRRRDRRQTLFTGEALAAMPTPLGAHILRYVARAERCDEITRMLYVDAKSYLVDNCLARSTGCRWPARSRRACRSWTKTWSSSLSASRVGSRSPAAKPKCC
jgi:asparagine synthase (glutamine-hydrolysing)